VMGIAYGFDTANYIYNVAASAKTKFGTGTFYIRYLGPSPAASVMTSSSGVSECRAAWDNGAKYLAFISAPTQSRLHGTAAMGTSDAQTFCANFYSVYRAVGPLVFQSSGVAHVYLDVEGNTNLSAAYWSGWASYIDGYLVPGWGYPLFPGMYCNPNSSTTNCSAVAASGVYCFSVWSNHPEPCTACGKFGSVSWGPYNCTQGYPTLVWQMAEQGGCQTTCARGSYPNVDVDMTNPSETEQSDMMYLQARP